MIMPRNNAAIHRRAEQDCIDTVENILGEPALRNRGVFDWLRGGKGTRLRVDAYFKRHNLVVEYQGKQHFSPNQLMDRREGRREQRARYDVLRRGLIPKHGIKFIEFRYDESITIKSVSDKLRIGGVI